MTAWSTVDGGACAGACAHWLMGAADANIQPTDGGAGCGRGAAGVHAWVQLTCIMQEEDERDDPGQNHVSRPHHKARPKHIFEHVPALAACLRLHPGPAVHTHAALLFAGKASVLAYPRRRKLECGPEPRSLGSSPPVSVPTENRWRGNEVQT